MKKLILVSALLLCSNGWAEDKMIDVENYILSNDMGDPAIASYVSQRCAALYLYSAELLNDKADLRDEYFLNSTILLNVAIDFFYRVNKNRVEAEKSVEENMYFMRDNYWEQSNKHYKLNGIYRSEQIKSDLDSCKLFAEALF